MNDLTREGDPRWQELQRWARRLYSEIGPGDQLCAAVLLTHGQGGESVAYLTDADGTVEQTIISPDGEYIRVPSTVSPAGGGV